MQFLRRLSLVFVTICALQQTPSFAALNAFNQFVPLNGIGTVTVAGNPACAPDVCRDINITCPGVQDVSQVRLQRTEPTGGDVATILYFTGTDGSSLWRADGGTFMANMMTDIGDEGYRHIQVVHREAPLLTPNGWTFGNQWNFEGGGKLACRVATAIKYAKETYWTPGTKFCAVGFSGGSGQIAFSLAWYGFEQYFDTVIFTGGVSSMWDYDDACNNPTKTPVYNVFESTYGWPADGTGPCENDRTELTPYWSSISINRSDADLYWANFPMSFLAGVNDNTLGKDYGLALYNQLVTGSETFVLPDGSVVRNVTTYPIVINHSIANTAHQTDTQEMADAVEDAIRTYCK